MKNETTFIEQKRRNEQGINSSENVGRKKNMGKRKISRVLMRQTVTEWTKENIYTKIKVQPNSEISDEFTVKEIPTDAFGVIDFKGAARKAKAQFVKVSDETPASLLVELFSRWKITKPQIVISVTGGAKLFKTNEHLKSILAKGLRKICRSPGTWVTTGGTNTGIMKFVGESLQGISNSIIGIATWGVISNSNSLRPRKNFPLGSTFEYEVESSFVEDGAYLDHNHTHFLLVDDSSTGEFGKETALSSRLIKHITYSQEKPIPSVLLVFEGGIHTLINIINAISGDLPIPVVVVKGSGRISNILAYAIELSENEDVTMENVKNKIEKHFEMFFPDINIEEKKEAISKVMTCLDYKHLITLFDFTEDKEIDKSILRAIFESYEMSQGSKLKYSLVWNRVDVAEDLLINKAKKWKKIDFEEAMVMGLALNRYSFVDLLMENCVGLYKIVTLPFLEFLYGYRSTRQQSIVYKMTDWQDFILFEEEHDKYFKLLKGVVYNNEEYGNKAKYLKYQAIENMISSLCEELKVFGNEIFVSSPSDFRTVETCSEYPYLDLFLWAVVNNMQQMALLLWKLGEEQIAKAIVAAHVYKKLALIAKKKGFSKELYEMFIENEREFKDLAISVLDECYSESMQKTKILLTMQLLQFSSHNCLSLAQSAGFEEFISHPAVQQLLNELWNGDIDFKNNMIRCKEQSDSCVSQRELQIDAFGLDTKEEFGKQDTIKDDSKMHLLGGLGEQERKKYNSFVDKDRVTTHEQKLSFFRRAYHYVFCRPASKFYRNLISYCSFLLLFAYVSTAGKTSTKATPLEIIVFIWVISLAFEEIYQGCITPGRSLMNKLEDYFANFFNIIDILAIILYLVAFAMQLNSTLMQYGHLLYAIDSMFWIVRLLQYFYANEILGPYVFMIGRMFIDMMYFISILGVFLLAYGVLSTSILQPQRTISGMLRDIVFVPYFNVYGELFIERDSIPGMTRFGTKKLNDYGETVSFICLGIFLLIANVLLLNLLIAIFGNTFSKVQNKSDQIWKFNRYGLITEYAMKPLVVPPITILFHIFMFVKWICLRICKNHSSNTSANANISDIQREEIEEFQIKNAVVIMQQQQADSESEAINTKLNDMSESLKSLQTQYNHLEAVVKDFSER